MIILDLISRDNHLDKRAFMVLGCVSGLANAMILAVINVAAAYVSNNPERSHTLYFMVEFLLILLVYTLAQRRLLVRATHHVENAIDHLRRDLVGRIRRCELATIEKIGREQIFSVMSKEMQTISQSAPTFVIVAQSSVLVVFTALYVAWLSMPAFFIVAVSISIGAVIHLMRRKLIDKKFNYAFEKENSLLAKLSDLLDGFKEIKLSRARAEELQIGFRQDSKDATQARKTVQTLFANDFVASQTSFYLALGAIVFLVPMVSHVDPEMITQVTMATLFLIGPISAAVGGLPNFAAANTAASNLLKLEKALESGQGETPATSTTTSTSASAPLVPIITEFKQIKLENLYFEHQQALGERAFEVGPINLTIEQGQTIFITGGNGSGKTTFIRLMMGLYPPSRGTMLVDGTVIGVDEIDAYRNLFSAVFSDFHLFKRLYGVSDYSDDEVDEWLEFLEMAHKVHLTDNAFSTVELSGGQRKRLALLSGVLENRPIYVFDEWAADQDPHFREKFYREVLPRLKARKQTVIAITHDDKFFDLADVHMRMEDGQLREISRKITKDS
ncbi:MAG: cyclic peptide export ABC transporter [Algicola sp.]|nr:cyclic peptide export ABC transporter [Algicola sp.]